METQSEKIFAQAARELKRPAGESPRFANFERIKENHRDFVIECHSTWKRWHGRAIEKILFYDAWAKREKEHPIRHSAQEFADYQRSLWRRVNDTIIWSLLGRQRHVVKRLCLYRPRSYLEESNARSALEVTSQMNANPLSIAIWNDATSCVDIGDITLVSDGERPTPQFIELKEGIVNEAISEILGSEQDHDAKLADFVKKYGKKGESQLNRVKRQMTTGDQALGLLRDDRGIDPVSGRYLEVKEVSTRPHNYDATLNKVVTKALASQGEAIEVVDGCLWVYASGAKKSPEAYRDFSRFLRSTIPDFAAHESVRYPEHDKDRIISINTGFAVPLAFPLFLRTIDPDAIGKICFGDLRDRVLLYMDWDAFGKLVNSNGAEFSWSSDKNTRRAQSMQRQVRPPTIRGRIPEIRTGNGIAFITDPNLVEMFFDGITPEVAIKRVLEFDQSAGGSDR